MKSRRRRYQGCSDRQIWSPFAFLDGCHMGGRGVTYPFFFFLDANPREGQNKEWWSRRSPTSPQSEVVPKVEDYW